MRKTVEQEACLSEAQAPPPSPLAEMDVSPLCFWNTDCTLRRETITGYVTTAY